MCYNIWSKCRGWKLRDRIPILKCPSVSFSYRVLFTPVALKKLSRKNPQKPLSKHKDLYRYKKNHANFVPTFHFWKKKHVRNIVFCKKNVCTLVHFDDFFPCVVFKNSAPALPLWHLHTRCMSSINRAALCQVISLIVFKFMISALSCQNFPFSNSFWAAS